MNTAITMLGSNFNTTENIELAIEKLSEHFELISQSAILVSKPVGEKYKADFHNIALKLLSDENAQETISIFKEIEIELGRTSESKQSGIIPIDIDLIFWNENLIHSDYDSFDFVRKCIDEIL